MCTHVLICVQLWMCASKVSLMFIAALLKWLLSLVSTSFCCDCCFEGSAHITFKPKGGTRTKRQGRWILWINIALIRVLSFYDVCILVLSFDTMWSFDLALVVICFPLRYEQMPFPLPVWDMNRCPSLNLYQCTRLFFGLITNTRASASWREIVNTLCITG